MWADFSEVESKSSGRLLGAAHCLGSGLMAPASQQRGQRTAHRTGQMYMISRLPGPRSRSGQREKQGGRFYYEQWGITVENSGV